MAEAPGVKQSCVVAHTDGEGTQRLAAYFVAAAGVELTADFLGRFFAGRVPAHMRPSSYTRLMALPLTVNGKLDASALPPPSMGEGANTQTQQSLSEIEQQVARVFLDTLDIRRHRTGR